nr:hypothetical protein GCM10025730_11670 [Promicromonospora thailandica]
MNLGTPHTTRMMHPQVGQLDLDMEKLAVMGTDRQMLVLLHADAASPTGERLALLASLAASTAPSSAPAEAPAESSSAPAEGAGSASPTTRPTDTT